MFAGVLNKMKLTDKNVSDEKWELEKGIFTLNMIFEKCIEKDKKLFAAFKDMESADDRIDLMEFLGCSENI